MVLRANEKTDSGQTLDKIPKNINLSFYDDEKVLQPAPSPKRSGVSVAVESYVRVARLKAVGVGTTVTNFNERLSTKYQTAKAHTHGVISFFQDEPELWQRCGIVAVAGFTGFISGYRRGSLIKTRNMLMAAGAAVTVCWPKQTVETVFAGYNYVKEPIVDLWTDYAPSSPNWPKSTAVIPPSKYYSNQPKVEEDLGQSKVEDKDMYSTRGS